MKKLLPVLVAVMFAVACGTGYFVYGAYQDYKGDNTKSVSTSSSNEDVIYDTYLEIKKSSEHAIELSSLVLLVWDKAIDYGFEFNSVFNYMFSGDVSNHEWSGLGMDVDGFSSLSWGSIANRMNLFESEVKALNRKKEEIDKLMDKVKTINDEDLNGEIDSLVQYYISYSKIFNAASAPSGNKLGYSSNLTSLINEYEGTKIEIEMKMK